MGVGSRVRSAKDGEVRAGLVAREDGGMRDGGRGYRPVCSERRRDGGMEGGVTGQSAQRGRRDEGWREGLQASLLREDGGMRDGERGYRPVCSERMEG